MRTSGARTSGARTRKEQREQEDVERVVGDETETTRMFHILVTLHSF